MSISTRFICLDVDRARRDRHARSGGDEAMFKIIFNICNESCKHSISSSILALTTALVLGGSSHAVAEKIMVSSHIGDATIIQKSGIDTDRASLVFRRELDDEIETCVRENPKAASNPSEIAASCARNLSRRIDRTTTTRRAYCSRNTLYTEFGNFSLVNWEKENSAGRVVVRTDWKDHRTEQLIGNCSGCNTPQLIDTYRILCPRSYDKNSQGFDMY